TDVVVCPSNYNNVENFNNVLNSNKKVWLYIPPYVSSNDLQIIDKVVDKFYGIFGEGYWCLQYAKTKKVKLFAGLGFNVFNDVDVYYLNNEGVQNISLSKELKASEIYKFNSDNFVLTRGAIELMDLIYCPFDKSCKNCKISNELTLQDTEKRNFSVLRYVLDGCRFKIFNCSTLLYDIKNFNQIYDLRTLTTSERNDILSNLTLTELKNKISNHTNGNFIKGTV
ncbi:MAG: hypothetical protein J6R88_03630, partial [Clostridia bacterium]|nr:hypothetical protein [Clostridia bacterium]